jgi:hypothetical protein
VDPSLRITKPILSIREGLSYQFQAQFFDESGTKVNDADLNWSTNPPSAISISDDGTITTLSPGNVMVKVTTQGLQGETISTELHFTITPLFIADDQTTTTETTTPTSETTTSTTDSSTSTTNNGIVVMDQFFEGQVRSTSSYLLRGNFRYEYNGEHIILSFDGSYRADRALPGLYVYLTNNPNTPMGGYEIGRVAVFEGEHQYSIPSSIALKDYKYILYW